MINLSHFKYRKINNKLIFLNLLETHVEILIEILNPINIIYIKNNINYISFIKNNDIVIFYV